MMGDPPAWGLPMAQILRAIQHGKELNETRKEVTGVQVDMNRLGEIIRAWVPTNTTPAETVHAPTATLLGELVSSLFSFEDTGGVDYRALEDMPPQTGLSAEGAVEPPPAKRPYL